jgi:Flp pilus assembly protein TadD
LTSFRVQHALWGLNPLPYRIVNLCFHILSALLLWRVLERLRVRGAWLGAALWAMHPVQVESVAWITELKNVQSCVFYLLAIWCFLYWLDTDRSSKSAYALALLSSTLALLSKTSTVMLPVVLGLCWWWRERNWSRRKSLTLIPFLLISVVAAVWTIWEQKFHSGAVGSEWQLSGLERLALVGKTFWFYLARLLWPDPLIFIYPRWTIDTSHALTFLPLIILITMLLVVWRYRNTGLGAVFFAIAYFVVSLFPVSGLFDIYFFLFSFVADHFQYLAAMGPLALAACGIVTAVDSVKQARGLLKPAVSGGLLLLVAILTAQQSRIYSSRLTLWRDTTKKNPAAWLAHSNLGAELDDQSRFDEAMAQYEEALRLYPRDAEAANRLAADLADRGKMPEAIEKLELVLQIHPDHYAAHNNLAIILIQLGRTDEALSHWEEAIRIKPDFADAHYNLGRALAGTTRMNEAISHFQRALSIRPNDADVQRDLALALEQKNRAGPN